MSFLILTSSENKSHGESLLKSLKERGLNSLCLKYLNERNELLPFLGKSSSFDCIILLGDRSYLEYLSEVTFSPLKASPKAIEAVEDFCAEFDKDPLDYRESVLLPKGSAPILGKGLNFGCALPYNEKAVIYLPLDYDALEVKRVHKLLANILEEMGEEVPPPLPKKKVKAGKASKKRGSCEFKRILPVILIIIAVIALFAGIFSIFGVSGQKEEPKEPERPVIIEEEPISFEDLFIITDEIHARMAVDEKARQDEIGRLYEIRRQELIEEEKIRREEYEAQLKEQQKLEAERKAKEEAERLEKERLEQERLAKLEEQQRLEEEKRLEEERLEEERLEQERLEEERREQEKEEQEWEEEHNANPPSTDEELYATVNGRIVAMNAYDLVLYAVQNETNGLMHPEALKAHAVASYTFFKYNNLHGVYPTLITKKSISPATKKAVDAVFGEAIYYKGNYINAVYHSTSCGETASAEDVWGGYLPYLVSVDSSWDKKAPNYETAASIKSRDFKKAVERTYGICLNEGDEDNWIEIIDYDDGGYVGTVSIGGYTTSQGGSYGKGRKISGRSVRENLLGFGIRSHCFDVYYDEGNDRFVFEVKGYGHGVGLSQYGAHFMAQDGYDYVEILEHYYTGTTVK